MIIIATQCFAPEIGGIESLITGLSRALCQRQQIFGVYADQSKSASKTFDDSFPCPILRFGGLKPWRRRKKARAINKALSHKNITCLITDSWKSLELLQIPTHVKSLCLVHGMEIPTNPNNNKKLRIQRALAKANVVVANSNYTAQRVKLFMSLPVHIIPPGLDLPMPPEAGDINQAKSKLGGHSPKLISVGRLQQHKGQDQVLRVLPKLTQDFPSLLYIILGEGPAQKELQKIINDLDIANYVLMPGSVNERERTAYLQASDIFVLPGREIKNNIEGFGIAFMDAALQGVPAVAGNKGGGVDAVVHNETGLICNGEDANAVLDAINNLLSDQELRTRMSESAKQRAQLFLWENIVTQYEKLLDLN